MSEIRQFYRDLHIRARVPDLQKRALIEKEMQVPPLDFIRELGFVTEAEILAKHGDVVWWSYKGIHKVDGLCEIHRIVADFPFTDELKQHVAAASKA